MTATAHQIEGAALFVKAGYSRLGSAAIMGNFSVESFPRIDTTVHRKLADHGSGGAGEWRLDRLTGPDGLIKFAADHKADVEALKTQCLFTIWELHSSPNVRRREWLNQMLIYPGNRSLANLTANFSQFFERPSKKYENLPLRIKHAEICLATLAADLTPAVPDKSEVVGSAVATAGAGGLSAWMFSYGIGGPLLAVFVTATAAAFLLFFYSLMKRHRAEPVEPTVRDITPVSPTTPVTLTPSDELKQAIEELSAANDRTNAAAAVMLADRTAGDELLAQLKAIHDGR